MSSLNPPVEKRDYGTCYNQDVANVELKIRHGDSLDRGRQSEDCRDMEGTTPLEGRLCEIHNYEGLYINCILELTTAANTYNQRP